MLVDYFKGDLATKLVSFGANGVTIFSRIENKGDNATH
jgi:hypothetical protein